MTLYHYLHIIYQGQMDTLMLLHIFYFHFQNMLVFNQPHHQNTEAHTDVFANLPMYLALHMTIHRIG